MEQHELSHFERQRCIGVSVVIAELDFKNIGSEFFNHRSNLPR